MDKDAVIADTEVRYLQSKTIGQEYRLYIAHPMPAGAPDKIYPVIYLLDADTTFGTVVETLRSLQISGDVPACYVVGIGYPMATFSEVRQARCRDYTPVRFPKFEENAHLFGPAQGKIITGGGPDFLDFICKELKPYIESEFMANPLASTITGTSFGGLFATFVLLNQPDCFQRYIICSPSLLFADKVMFKQEAQYAAKNKDLPARVFMTAGSLETHEEMKKTMKNMPGEMADAVEKIWKPEMVELINPFVDRLISRDYPNLQLTRHFFDGEHHNSVYPAAVSRGLRVVFGS